LVGDTRFLESLKICDTSTRTQELLNENNKFMRAVRDGLGCHDVEKATREKPFQNSTFSQIS